MDFISSFKVRSTCIACGSPTFHLPSVTTAIVIGTTIGPLVSFRGVITAVNYIAALQETLLPFLDTLPADIEIDFIFQQDNARIHTANISKQWLDQQAFILME